MNQDTGYVPGRISRGLLARTQGPGAYAQRRAR